MPEVRERETNAAVVGFRRARQWQQIFDWPEFQRRRLLRRRLRLQLARLQTPERAIESLNRLSTKSS